MTIPGGMAKDDLAGTNPLGGNGNRRGDLYKTKGTDLGQIYGTGWLCPHSSGTEKPRGVDSPPSVGLTVPTGTGLGAERQGLQDCYTELLLSASYPIIHTAQGCSQQLRRGQPAPSV